MISSSASRQSRLTSARQRARRVASRQRRARQARPARRAPRRRSGRPPRAHADADRAAPIGIPAERRRPRGAPGEARAAADRAGRRAPGRSPARRAGRARTRAAAPRWRRRRRGSRRNATSQSKTAGLDLAGRAQLADQLGGVGRVRHARDVACRAPRGSSVDVEPLERHQLGARRARAPPPSPTRAQPQAAGEPPLALARAARQRREPARVAAEQRHDRDPPRRSSRRAGRSPVSTSDGHARRTIAGLRIATGYASRSARASLARRSRRRGLRPRHAQPFARLRRTAEQERERDRRDQHEDDHEHREAEPAATAALVLVGNAARRGSDRRPGSPTSARAASVLRVDRAIEQAQRTRLVDADRLRVRANETAHENVRRQTRKSARLRAARSRIAEPSSMQRRRQSSTLALRERGGGSFQSARHPWSRSISSPRLVDEFSLTFLDSYCLSMWQASKPLRKLSTK